MQQKEEVEVEINNKILMIELNCNLYFNYVQQKNIVSINQKFYGSFDLVQQRYILAKVDILKIKYLYL